MKLLVERVLLQPSSTRFSSLLLLLLLIASCGPAASAPRASVIAGPRGASFPDRGLLASPEMNRQPMKAIYFFPGERGKNQGLYTTHPLDDRDAHWNSDREARSWVMDNMVRAHVNTIVMSYWSESPRSSPMALDADSLTDVLDAIGDRKLVVLPAIEGSKSWQFANEFPRADDG